MDTLIHRDNTYSLSEAAQVMEGKIRQAADEISRHVPATPNIIRIEIKIKNVPILRWLKNQRKRPQIYWSKRDRPVEVAGVGSADRLTGRHPGNYEALFSHFTRHLTKCYPNLRYYGGVCFDPLNVQSEWDDFNGYQFLIPRFEILKTRGITLLACNFRRNETSESVQQICDDLQGLSWDIGTDLEEIPSVHTRQDYPNHDAWINIVQGILNSITRGQGEKIVLARKSLLQFHQPLNPVVLLERFKRTTSQCFYFYFQPKEGSAFLGASPERLYERQGRFITTEAIAGTRARGESSQDDERLKTELLTSTKEAHEHALVVSAIEKILSAFCVEFKSETPQSPLQLEEGQHLISHFQGQLKSEISDAALLKALHPTPAVGGTPTEAALRTIRQREPFSRGWYAVPIGCVGFDHAEFAVAIRSGLIIQDQLSLYAGAGIVSGSFPQSEWEEVENKVGRFLKILKAD